MNGQLVLLIAALLAYPAVTASAEQGGLEAAWERAREADAYAFTTDVEQTLIPRPLPDMIGQTDERVDMRIEGDVTLPDQMQMELRFEGGGLDAPPLALVQDGTETYLLKDGERIPIENPAGLASPTSDYLSYLAAAENVQQLDEPSPDGFTRYAYDINGPRFAEHVREQMQAQLEGMPDGVQLSPSPLLQRMSGHGELWVDADGLPLFAHHLQQYVLADHARLRFRRLPVHRTPGAAGGPVAPALQHDLSRLAPTGLRPRPTPGNCRTMASTPSRPAPTITWAMPA